MLLILLLTTLALARAIPRPDPAPKNDGKHGYPTDYTSRSTEKPDCHDAHTYGPTGYYWSSDSHIASTADYPYVTPTLSISVSTPVVAAPTTTAAPALTTIADIPPFNLDAHTLAGGGLIPETVITEAVTQTLYSPSLTTVGPSTFYTEVPVSSTVISPQVTASPPTTDVPVTLRPGTEVNNGFVVSPGNTTTFRLTEPDYRLYLGYVDSTPQLPPPTSCVYEYQSVLGGSYQTPYGSLWNIESGDLSDLLSIEDVVQGAIGDCGLGAAVMAMITSGNVEYLRGLTVPILARPDPEDVTVAFLFRDGETFRITVVSDAVPKLVSGGCHPLLGYQRSLGERNYLYMPLIEKAFAKYFDAYPELSADGIFTPETAGYVGMEGAPVANIFAAFTGGSPRTWRRYPELEASFEGFPAQVQPELLVATYNCLTLDAPCTAAFPPPGDLAATYGELDEFGSLFITPPGQPSFGLITPLGSGVDGPTFNLYDFDQLIDGRYSTQFNLVGGHAYAIDKTRSFWPTDGSSLRTGRVTLLNPWGCNPRYVPNNAVFNDATGFCDPGPNRPREVTMSLTMFLSTVRYIRTVEDMLPPLEYA